MALLCELGKIQGYEVANFAHSTGFEAFFASVLCENWAFWDKYRSIYAHEETESIRGKKSIKRKGLMSAGKQ